MLVTFQCTFTVFNKPGSYLVLATILKMFKYFVCILFCVKPCLWDFSSSKKLFEPNFNYLFFLSFCLSFFLFSLFVYLFVIFVSIYLSFFFSFFPYLFLSFFQIFICYLFTDFPLSSWISLGTHFAWEIYFYSILDFNISITTFIIGSLEY